MDMQLQMVKDENLILLGKQGAGKMLWKDIYTTVPWLRQNRADNNIESNDNKQLQVVYITTKQLRLPALRHAAT